jgi:hypothetical protein
MIPSISGVCDDAKHDGKRTVQRAGCKFGALNTKAGTGALRDMSLSDTH